MKRCNLDILSCGFCKHPEFMTRKGAPLLSATFPSLVGVIRHPQAGIILFDTGYDHAFFTATSPFPERLYRWATPVTLAQEDGVVAQLNRIGIAADDVAIIVISHFHADHVSGLHHFRNAKIMCAKAGLDACTSKSRMALTLGGLLPKLLPPDLSTKCAFFETCTKRLLPRELMPFTEGADLLGDGSLLMVELPGHCAGHWGMVIRTEADQYVFFIADAAWSTTAIQHNAAPPRMTSFLLGNTKNTRITLSRLHEIAERNHQNTTLLPSHCAQAIQSFVKGD